MGSKTFLCFWGFLGLPSRKLTYPPKMAFWVDDFPNFPRWDMLIPWRVFFSSFCWRLTRYLSQCQPQEALARFLSRCVGRHRSEGQAQFRELLGTANQKKTCLFFCCFSVFEFFGGVRVKTNSGRNIKTNLDKKNDLMSVARDPGSLKLRMVEHGS